MRFWASRLLISSFESSNQSTGVTSQPRHTRALATGAFIPQNKSHALGLPRPWAGCSRIGRPYGPPLLHLHAGWGPPHTRPEPCSTAHACLPAGHARLFCCLHFSAWKAQDSLVPSRRAWASFSFFRGDPPFPPPPPPWGGGVTGLTRPLPPPPPPLPPWPPPLLHHPRHPHHRLWVAGGVVVSSAPTELRGGR